jgi:hypothetical protein
MTTFGPAFPDEIAAAAVGVLNSFGRRPEIRVTGSYAEERLELLDVAAGAMRQAEWEGGRPGLDRMEACRALLRHLAGPGFSEVLT